MGNIFGYGTPNYRKIREQTIILNHQIRGLDKEIARCVSDEATAIKEVERRLDTQTRSSARHSARHLVRMRKRKERLMITASHLEGIKQHLQSAYTTVKIGEYMREANECMANVDGYKDVMKTVNEYARNSSAMSDREELVGDALGDVFDEEADEEVDEILADIIHTRDNKRMVFPDIPVHPLVFEEVGQHYQEEEGKHG